MKPGEDVLSARICLKCVVSWSTVPGSSRRDPEPQTWSTHQRGSLPSLFCPSTCIQTVGISAAIRFNYCWGRQFVSVSIKWHSCFLSRGPDVAPQERGHHLLLRQRTQARVHIILYQPIYRSLNLLSPVSRHVGQLSAGGQLASVSTVHILYRHGFSCSYSMRKWTWDM